MPFPPNIKQQALAKSGRRCCICLRFKGIKVEVHHIVPEAKSKDNSLNNAITLCFDCHSDAGHYNVKHPKGNKLTPNELRKHRDRLWKLVSEGKVLPEGNLDGQYIQLLSKAFDRAAFKTPFKDEGRMDDFEKAIDDTLLALNTGVLRTRDNQVVSDIGIGKSSIINAKWRRHLNSVEKELCSLRAFVAKSLADGTMKSCHAYCYCGDPHQIGEIDRKRAGIIDSVNAVLSDAGFVPLPNILGNYTKLKQSSPTNKDRS